MAYRLTSEDRQAWTRDGYVIVRGLFDAEETALLRGAIETDPLLKASLYERKDAQGHATRIALWNEPGDSVYGLAARSERVVDTMQDLLGAEVYHYHSKLCLLYTTEAADEKRGVNTGGARTIKKIKNSVIRRLEWYNHYTDAIT